MIGRLIEDEQVDWFEQETYHRQTTAFAAREHLHFLLDVLASEHESSEDILDACADITYSHTIYCVEDCEIFVKQLCLILCEVANLHAMANLQFTIERYLIHDTLH